MGEVGAAQRAALHALPPRQFQPGQVGAAVRLAALDDARRDRRDDRMKRHIYSLLKMVVKLYYNPSLKLWPASTPKALILRNAFPIKTGKLSRIALAWSAKI